MFGFKNKLSVIQIINDDLDEYYTHAKDTILDKSNEDGLFEEYLAKEGANANNFHLILYQFVFSIYWLGIQMSDIKNKNKFSAVFITISNQFFEKEFSQKIDITNILNEYQNVLSHSDEEAWCQDLIKLFFKKLNINYTNYKNFNIYLLTTIPEYIIVYRDFLEELNKNYKLVDV